MQTIISLVGGLMLGIGVFHMLPHALHEVGDINFVARWMMLGLLVMFFLLRTFHFHQHDVVVDDHEAQPAQLLADEHALNSTHDHDHDHDDGHSHGHSHGHHHHAHELSWLGISVGLCLHTLIDGLALGAAVEADAHHEVLWSLFGLGDISGNRAAQTARCDVDHQSDESEWLVAIVTQPGQPRLRNNVPIGRFGICIGSEPV